MLQKQMKYAMTVHANKNYDSMSRHDGDPRIALLKELADPLRLRVIDRLGHGGPATVTRMASEFGVPLPQLSNHLRRLRHAGMVTAQRSGRQVSYELADPGLELLTPLLDSITGRVHSPAPRAPGDHVPSRTCYGHLAGEIGVGIYRALCEHDALRPRPDGMVELGPEATPVLDRLGVDAGLAPAGRQRLAFECLDATERVPHLAGALGDAIAHSLADRRWITHVPDSRVYSVTPAGRRGLGAAIALSDLP
jgi:DNA-binding transcriptional ArsR family regulator